MKASILRINVKGVREIIVPWEFLNNFHLCGCVRTSTQKHLVSKQNFAFMCLRKNIEFSIELYEFIYNNL